MYKILITGATGHLGVAVIDTLLKKIPANAISVITRREEKQMEFKQKGFDAHIGDYTDPASLDAAMVGVDKVLLISAGDQGDRMQEHKNVIDAAKKMGVKCIAYTGRSLRDRSTLANMLMEDHFATEDYISASGLNHIFFRNILYMDTIPQFIGGKGALENGIFLPAGDGTVAFALRSEMGEAIAKVLLQNTCENKIYNFTGSNTYSFHDVAATLTELTGKEIKYTHITAARFAEMMKHKNVPEPAIKKIIDFVSDIEHNQEAGCTNDLELMLGRKPTGLKEGLKMLFEL